MYWSDKDTPKGRTRLPPPSYENTHFFDIHVANRTRRYVREKKRSVCEIVITDS